MKATWLIAIMLAGFAAPAAAQRPTSAYTRLNAGRCQLIERIEEGAGTRERCPGHAGVPLFLTGGDARFDLDAGVDNGVWESLSPPNGIGGTVEWRLHRGRPVAIIYRLIPSAEAQMAPVLIVETIGRRGRRGCEIARVNAQRADANERARSEADLRAGTFRCGRDRIAEIDR